MTTTIIHRPLRGHVDKGGERQAGRAVCLMFVSLFLVFGCAQRPSKPQYQATQRVMTAVPERYRVQAGDTVGKIAAKYGLNWREVSAKNRLDANHTIYVGQWLTLSGLSIHQDTPPTRAISTPTVVPSANVAVSTRASRQSPTTAPRLAYPVMRSNSIAKQFGAQTAVGPTEGIFFSGLAGDLVLASGQGKVVAAHQYAGRMMVIVSHGGGYTTTYLDLADVGVGVGQEVRAGDRLGKMLSQTSSGLGLFEFRVAYNGRYIDPAPLLFP